MFKKLIHFLTVPRYIEFGTLEEVEEVEEPVFDRQEACKNAIDNKYLYTAFYVRQEILKNENREESIKLLAEYEKSRALKYDGLLISNSQAKEEAKITFEKYKEANFIDELNKLKPSIEESLKEMI